ncbi:MtN3 and saliva related transmembrane protein [Spiroplasma gladiatoris]|uniref:MtN3 and saliva related transmembrane protein n=1 Tax=Spiroplasma gladiatoris TaxID=2143 RepID=A0A4P7AGC6_9MOLU|nr:SemiSWEET family transporter [Spiroplasma gladiatoris]QBQ07414.1 MtN3 and saliva related transmembrane protein [Spiroplasma gladiatoris]
MSFNDILSWIASISLVSSLIPQIIRIAQRRSAKDVSLITILFFVIGNGIWVVYAALINYVQLLVTNTLLCSFGWILLILKTISSYKYKKYLNFIHNNEHILNLNEEDLINLINKSSKEKK